MTTSIWITNKRYSFATREMGQLSLISHRGKWCLLLGFNGTAAATEKGLSLYSAVFDVSSIEEAVEAADAYLPPDGWTYKKDCWVAGSWGGTKEGVWEVRRVIKDHWMIYGLNGELLSKRTFERADLARKWCEIRKDRVGLNLRGPISGGS